MQGDNRSIIPAILSVKKILQFTTYCIKFCWRITIGKICRFRITRGSLSTARTTDHLFQDLGWFTYKSNGYQVPVRQCKKKKILVTDIEIRIIMARAVYSWHLNSETHHDPISRLRRRATPFCPSTYWPPLYRIAETGISSS